jgi:hypothetical protein
MNFAVDTIEKEELFAFIDPLTRNAYFNQQYFAFNGTLTPLKLMHAFGVMIEDPDNCTVRRGFTYPCTTPMSSVGHKKSPVDQEEVWTMPAVGYNGYTSDTSDIDIWTYMQQDSMVSVTKGNYDVPHLYEPPAGSEFWTGYFLIKQPAVVVYPGSESWGIYSKLVEVPINPVVSSISNGLKNELNWSWMQRMVDGFHTVTEEEEDRDIGKSVMETF